MKALKEKLSSYLIIYLIYKRTAIVPTPIAVRDYAHHLMLRMMQVRWLKKLKSGKPLIGERASSVCDSGSSYC
jgi:hypothetical protein